MDPNTIAQLALIALNAALQLIANVKAQTGMTDDQILAHAQQVSQGNDAAYAAMKAALTPASS